MVVRLGSDTPSLKAWRILGCVTAVTITAAAIRGFTVPLLQVGTSLLLSGGLMAASQVGRERFKSDVMAEICALFAFWIAMLSALLPASYVAASMNFPLIDTTLQQWDRAIGFDWLALQRWTDATEWAAISLTWVYQASIIQIPIAIFVLAGRRDLGRLNIYIMGLLISTVATVCISALLPAAGAYRAYGIAPNATGNIAALCDVLHFLPDFDAVRSGALRTLSGPLDGIIQFPSFHTVVAVTAAWATWRTPWVGAVNALLTVLVLVSTLPIGSHHFMDVAGGVAVSAFGIYAASRLEAPVVVEMAAGSAQTARQGEGAMGGLGKPPQVPAIWQAWLSQFLTAMTTRR
jgi:membrane-associated phospholipid phosphatase